MTKVGLYFGSFNPVHNGHLKIANYLLQITDLKEIWFVVSPQNPLKEDSTLADEQARLDMAKLAVESEENILVSDFEFELERPSYTRTTLTALVKKFPDRDFHLIMGEDNIRIFHLWKNYESILEDFVFFVYPRDTPIRDGEEGFSILELKNVRYQTFSPKYDISSTQVREAIGNGENIRSLVPESVADYIEQKNIYR